MKTKHTPGPWDVHETSVGLEIHPISDINGLIVIADVQGTQQNRANANLIAQAPAMAELLKRMAEQILKLGLHHGDGLMMAVNEAKHILAEIDGAA
jgi:hypothetical protein